jgi:hypothetical protein
MANNLMAATTAAPSVLVSQQLASSETTQYTSPTGSTNSGTKIASAVIANTNAVGGASVTVSISIVKVSGTAGAANRVLPAFTLVAGDDYVLGELAGQFLGPGDFISALASTASVVSLVVSGIAFS